MLGEALGRVAATAEAAGAILLLERVAAGVFSVPGRVGANLVAVVGNRLTRGELDQVELISEPADQASQGLEELA